MKQWRDADIAGDFCDRDFGVSNACDLLTCATQIGSARLAEMGERLDERGCLARSGTGDHDE